jgi:hypothetical protein
VHNFFRGAKAVAAGVVAAAKTRGNNARARSANCTSKHFDVTKTHIPSVFLQIVEIFTMKYARAKIFGSALRRPPPRAWCTARAGGAYTQN